MSNTDWDDDEDDLDADEVTQPTNGDSNLLKQLRKAKRADEKRIKELMEKVESFDKAERQRVISQVLDQKGVNPKAAKFIANELTEVNEQSVIDWLASNGDVFGYKPQQVDPEQQLDRAALRQQDIVTQGALSPDKQLDAETRINNATQAELLQMIASGEF